MIEDTVGCIAYSLAGHDKGHIYLIIKEEKEYVKKAYTKNHYKESKSVKSVRKIYKMAILKGTKGDVPDCSSLPSKLTKDNITEDEIKAAAITQIYEKARYSEEKITEEETDLIKNYINNAFK